MKILAHLIDSVGSTYIQTRKILLLHNSWMSLCTYILRMIKLISWWLHIHICNIHYNEYEKEKKKESSIFFFPYLLLQFHLNISLVNMIHWQTFWTDFSHVLSIGMFIGGTSAFVCRYAKYVKVSNMKRRSSGPQDECGRKGTRESKRARERKSTVRGEGKRWEELRDKRDTRRGRNEGSTEWRERNFTPLRSMPWMDTYMHHTQRERAHGLHAHEHPAYTTYHGDASVARYVSLCVWGRRHTYTQTHNP